MSELPEDDGLDLLRRDGQDAMARYLAAIVENSDDAILSKDLNGFIRSWNKGAERLFGYTAEEAIGEPITILIPHDRQSEEPEIIERIRRGQRIEHYETVRQRKHGSLIHVSLTLSPIKNGQGKIVGASKIVRDITERIRAQEHQQFLIRELQHRTQNLFSVIQMMVNRTLVEGHTVAEGKELLNARLQALAQAHSMLADAAWEGVSLLEIIKVALDGFAQHSTVGGCDILVNTPAAQQFALTIHELTINAIKYGALSTPGGRILIDCHIEKASRDETFSFVWKEIGGPRVTPPTRKGFGSVILLDAARQFRPKLKYEPEGLSYELRAPLSAIQSEKRQQASAAKTKS